MNDDLRQYRAHLVETVRFLNEAYDKMLLTLAGGALGLSLVFLSDVVTLPMVQAKLALVVGWIAFVASLACVLGRILFGIEANRKAINQVDEETIYEFRPGMVFAKISRTLHIASALLLVVGLLSMAVFMYSNVG